MSVSCITVSCLLFVVVDAGVPTPRIKHVEGIGIHFIQTSLVYFPGNLNNVFLLQHLQRPLDMAFTEPGSSVKHPTVTGSDALSNLMKRDGIRRFLEAKGSAADV